MPCGVWTAGAVSAVSEVSAHAGHGPGPVLPVVACWVLYTASHDMPLQEPSAFNESFGISSDAAAGLDA